MKLTLKEKSLIELIKSDESYSNYFFGKYDKIKLFPILKTEGFFSSEHNPTPKKVKNGYQIPEWNVLQYLERISKKTRTLDDELLKIVKEVSIYKDDKGNHIDNYRTWWFFVKILLNIPLSKVPYEIFDVAMLTWLTSMFDLTLPGADLTDDLLPAYLNQAESKEDIRKVERLVDILLSVKEPQKKKSMIGETVEVQTKIDHHWLEESFITKNNAVIVAQKCTTTPIFNLANTIRDFFSKKYKDQDYSSIWLRDLTKEEKRTPHNSEHLLAVILRKIILEKMINKSSDCGEIIEKFLSNTYPHYLFKRLALLLIAEAFNSYVNYFDQILDNQDYNYFEVDSFEPELTYLLSKNIAKLTIEQRTKIAKIIEKGPSRDLPDNRKEEYKNYWKQRWYKVLELIPEFKMLYDNLETITKRKIVLKAYEDFGEMRDVAFDKSPVTSEGLLSKSNIEIINIISGYKPTGEFPNASPNGLYRTFQSAVELSPTKFTQNLKPFQIQNYHMLSSLFNGLEEAWKQKRDILWENVIDFTLKLIQENWFWKPTDIDRDRHYNYYDWTLSAIGDLLQEGCKIDDWAFPEKLHKDIEKIITLLIDQSLYLYDKDSYHGDGVTHALNSNWGKTITALIYLALREARLSDKKGEKKKSKWSQSLKVDFEKSLDKKIYEAYTLLGQYLPNLHYIDKEWTETKTKNMHLVQDEKYFETFMEGYLFTGKVYEKLYKLLRNSYDRALTVDFEEKRIQERLIQHIAVGYLRGNEELGNNSLLDKLFKMKKSEYIREAVEFLWHQSDYIADKNNSNESIEKEKNEFRQRIFILWDWIIDLYNKNKELNEEDRKVLSELSKLALYLPELDQKSFERLLFSAPHVTVDFDSPYFIEYLNQLKENGDKTHTAKYVAVLFLAMLRGSEDLIPDYKWENVEEIVTHLYQVGKIDSEVKDLTNQICIFYAEHRNLRLRKIYEENNAI